MKRKLIIAAILFLGLALCVRFFNYIFIFEVDNKRKQKVFDLCNVQADVSKIPKTAVEWRKQNPKQYFRPALEMLQGEYGPFNKIAELAISLGDIVDENHKNSFYSGLAGFDRLDNAHVYYDYKGDLLFFEKSAGPSSWGICRYDSTGKLVEFGYSTHNLDFGFTTKKHLMYRCYMGSCATLFEYKKHK